MSANLYPGIKSLYLILQRPYDLIRTTDVRDDLSGVKIWVSKTSNFNITTTTPYADGNAGLMTQITGLDEDTTYYVKYAFISKIDPDTYTVASQLSAKTLAAGVHVYGYLTNDPVGIATDSAGVVSASTNWQTVTNGVFKVYNDNTDVTGANTSNVGPVYSIKSGSTLGGLTATINDTTGAYYATGMTDDNGSVTFQAVYNGVTIERVWSVYKGKAGQLAPIITLTANVKEFIYKDINATTSQTTSSTITATLTNLSTQPTFTIEFYTRAGVSLGSGVSGTDFTVTTTAPYTLTITNSQFSAKGITLGYATVTATIGSVFDSLTLYRLNDGTDQITVEQSNPSHTLSAAANGDTVTANYVGSANIITVYKGITKLSVDNVSPYALNTWYVKSAVGTNITPDQSPEIGSNYITYDPAAAMTADDAYIDYTITVQTTATTSQDFVVRQSFAKSKQGNSSRAVNLTADRLAFITAKNTTTPAPNTITLLATQSSFTSPVYSWTVDGQAPGSLGTASGNTFTLNKFTSGGSKLVRVTVAESTGGYSEFDELSIFSLKEGDDAIVGTISNENQTISCDSTGTVKTGQFPFTTTFLVAQGSRLINGTSTPSVVFGPSGTVGTNMASTIDSSTGVITVTGISSEFASATYTATVNGITLTKTLNLNKSIDGSNAPVVNLTSTGQIFIVAKNTGTVSPTTQTFTASAYNVGTSPSIVWKVDGVTQAGQTGYTFSLASFNSGTKTVRVEVTAGGVTVFDVMTVYALKEGDDSLAAGLGNENQAVVCDNTGALIGSQPLSSQFVVFRGTTNITINNGITYSLITSGTNATTSGVTATIDYNTGAISVTNIAVANTVYIMQVGVRATIGSTTIDKVLTINKSLNGKTPVKGTDYVDGKSTYTATVYLQQATAPSTPPSGGSYNFTTSTLTEPTGWTKTLPTTSATLTTYISEYTFISAIPGDTITANTWSTPVAYVKNGTNGTTPVKGVDYTDGLRGIANLTRLVSYDLKSQTATYYATTGGAGTVGYECQQAFNDAYTGTVDRTPRPGDRVTLYQTAWSNTYLYAVGGYWSYVALKVDGGLIVEGTISASSLTIGKTTATARIQISENKIEVFSSYNSNIVRRVVIGEF